MATLRRGPVANVDRSGGVTALHYAHLRAAVLRGGTLGLDVAGPCDINDDGMVSVQDLATRRRRRNARRPSQDPSGSQAPASGTRRREAALPVVCPASWRGT